MADETDKKEEKEKNSKKLGVALGVAGLLLFIGIGFFMAAYYQKKMNREVVNEPLKVYQTAVEKKVSHDISEALNRLIGKGGYAVSVVANLEMESRIVKKVNMNPQIVTFNKKQIVTKGMQKKDEDGLPELGNNLPGGFDDVLTLPLFNDGLDDIDLGGLAFADIKSSDTLPGFSPDAGLGDELPGFSPEPPPSINKKTDQSDENIYNPNQVTKKDYGQKVYYNEETSTQSIPGTKIKTVSISLLIDNNRFEKSGLKKNNLESLLSKIASIDKKRGDKIYITYVDFESATLKRNIIIILALLSIIGLFFGVNSFLKKRQKLKQEQLEKQRKEEEEQKEIEKMKALEEQKEWKIKRDAIVESAQSKPKEVANILLDWIEHGDGG